MSPGTDSVRLLEHTKFTQRHGGPHSLFWSCLKSILIWAFATCCLTGIIACSQLAGLLYPSADLARILPLFDLKRQRNSSLSSLWISNSAITFLSGALDY